MEYSLLCDAMYMDSNLISNHHTNHQYSHLHTAFTTGGFYSMNTSGGWDFSWPGAT